MNILIVSPHADDEALGCSSFLQDKNNETTVFYGNTQHCYVEADVVRQENRELLYYTKCKGLYSLFSDCINQLETKPVSLLVSEYETIINKVKPDLILLPFPSYNQDHRVMYKAFLTALRPHDRIFFVKKILVYESVETFGTLGSVFIPNYFKNINVDEKIKIYKFYKSQLREHRSFDNIKTIAKLRGIQSHKDCAEGFEILRWVE